VCEEPKIKEVFFFEKICISHPKQDWMHILLELVHISLSLRVRRIEVVREGVVGKLVVKSMSRAMKRDAYKFAKVRSRCAARARHSNVER
jgi:hypothetical protein